MTLDLKLPVAVYVIQMCGVLVYGTFATEGPLNVALFAKSRPWYN